MLFNFSNEALQAAQSGYLKLINGLKALNELTQLEDNGAESTDQSFAKQVKHDCDCCYKAMNDDFNTAQVIAALFNLLRTVYALKNRKLSPNLLGAAVFEQLKNTYATFVRDILGLDQQPSLSATALLDTMIRLYSQAKAHKRYDQVDAIRSQLRNLGVALQDTPMGVEWSYA